jgi:hypothetical protein
VLLLIVLLDGKIAGTAEAGDSPPVDLRKGNRKNWNIILQKSCQKCKEEKGK